MNEQCKSALRMCHASLVSDLDMKYILYRMSTVFSADLEETIMAEPTRADRVRTFLQILPKRGPHAFHAFLTALEEDYSFLKVKLEDALQSTASTEDTDWLHVELTESGRNRMMSEHELSVIARDIPNVMCIGASLGFKQGRLEQLRESYPYNVSAQVCKLFSAWLAKVTSHATVENFVKCMRQAELGEHVYKGVILKHSTAEHRQGVFV